LVSNVNNLDNFELMVAPNPAKLDEEPVHFIYRLDNSGEAEVRIYSLSGELLYKFEENLPAGTGEFTWDGETDFGDKVANGVYLVFVKITDRNTGKTELKKIKLAVLN
jgi:flagellar hook assembly protein FlgD